LAHAIPYIFTRDNWHLLPTGYPLIFNETLHELIPPLIKQALEDFILKKDLSFRTVVTRNVRRRLNGIELGGGYRDSKSEEAELGGR
jgi:hypothetical protein